MYVGGGSGLDLAKMVERYGGVFGEGDEELDEAQEKWRHSTADFPQAAILKKTTKRLAEAVSQSFGLLSNFNTM